MDGKLNKKLDKLERHVIDTKKGKQTRDRIDYESHNVYVWKQLPYQHKRGRKNRAKKVSFSDFDSEAAYDTQATSGSESSPDRGNIPTKPSNSEGTRSGGHPRVSNKEARKKNIATRKPDGEGRGTGTRNTPYALYGEPFRNDIQRDQRFTKSSEHR